MKREIKFRVWTGNEMEYSILAGIFGVFYINPGREKKGLDPEDSLSLNPNNTKYPEDTPLMQFTGLKDKNGKDIYEGDIVDISTFKGDSILRMVINDIMQMPNELYGSNVDWCEVIGSVYENPELLK